MGTQLCFYHISSLAGNAPAQIQPPAIEYNSILAHDAAPAEHWDTNILEEEGEVRLRTVVDEIRKMCVALEQ